MPRWEPDARERLVTAALQLFSEQGYDETTVAEIAQQAGLTKSTFHRHFPDKRDVLAAGQEKLSRLLAEGIAAAPADASPLEAVAEGLRRASKAFRPELAALVAAAVASSAELQERTALKQVGMAAAMAGALVDRGAAEPVARLAGEIGALALKQGFAAWVAGETRQDLGELMCIELDRLRTTAAQL
jgi:AcrR family transcriptional regulator